MSAGRVTLAVIANKIDNLTELVKKVDVIVHGDGGEVPGLVTRVDRIEQQQQNREKQEARQALIIRGLVGAVVPMVLKFAYELIK